MVTCELCGKEVKNTQALGGHYRFAHQQERSKPEQASFLAPRTLATEEQLEQMAEQLREEVRQTLDQHTEKVEQTLSEYGGQLLERLDELAGRLEELEILGQQVDGLEEAYGQNSKDLGALTKFVRDDVLPAIERRLPDNPQALAVKVRLEGQNYDVLPSGAEGYEPARRCRHYAPPGSETCDSLECVRQLIEVKTPDEFREQQY